MLNTNRTLKTKYSISKPNNQNELKLNLNGVWRRSRKIWFETFDFNVPRRNILRTFLNNGRLHAANMLHQPNIILQFSSNPLNVKRTVSKLSSDDDGVHGNLSGGRFRFPVRIKTITDTSRTRFCPTCRRTCWWHKYVAWRDTNPERVFCTFAASTPLDGGPMWRDHTWRPRSFV